MIDKVPRKIRPLLSGVLFGIIGLSIIFVVQAATPEATFEADAGARSSNALLATDTTASNNKAIKFGSGVTTPPQSGQTMLMGSSASPNDHGGTEEWDVWRVYREGPMLTLANRTGNLRPKALAYSEDGPNLGGSNPNYTTVYNHVMSKLNSFYYTSASGQTHSSRWGIKLFWSNGNENHDKGALAEPHTAAGISAYTTSQRALYEAAHYIDPATGQRRFPDAYAGSNPTHEAEFKGVVEDWLHASAMYHDFVMWSMYPPGRNTTITDPTFNWPSFNEADRTNRERGFLIRGFYRTKQAQAFAGHPLMIAVGEIGIPDDPDDGTTRPFYAAHGLAHGLNRLSGQYGLEIPFACWWDQQVDPNEPSIILSDEPAGLNPTTRQAWQNWTQYDHLRGGTHPSSWAGNPKSSWKTTGTFPTQ